MCASHVRQCGYVVSGSANADARMVVVPDRQQCYGYIYLPAQLRLSSPVSVQGARVLPAGRCGPVGSLHRKGSKRAPQTHRQSLLPVTQRGALPALLPFQPIPVDSFVMQVIAHLDFCAQKFT